MQRTGSRRTRRTTFHWHGNGVYIGSDTRASGEVGVASRTILLDLCGLIDGGTVLWSVTPPTQAETQFVAAGTSCGMPDAGGQGVIAQ